MAQKKIEIMIEVKSDLEAIIITAALQNIAKNITTENISLLGEKSKGFGINAKIQSFKNFI